VPHAWRARIEKGRFSRKQILAGVWHVSTDTCALTFDFLQLVCLDGQTRCLGSFQPEDHDTQLFVDHYKEKSPEGGCGLFVSLLPFAVNMMIGAGIVGLSTLSWCAPFSPIYLLLYFHAQNFRITIKLWFIVNVTLFERGNSLSIFLLHLSQNLLRLTEVNQFC
jgi:hypothetical protein